MVESIGIKKPVYDVLKHTSWKLSEASFFLGEMEARSTSTLGEAGFNDFKSTPEQIAEAQQFLFCFSAMLSAWQTAYYYMQNYCERKDPETKQVVDAKACQWFTSLRGRQLLWAFSLLRNSDVHDGMLSSGVQYRVNLGLKTTGQGFCLNGTVLSYRECFQKHPWALDILTERPIIPIAQDALRDIREVVAEGAQAGHLSPQ